MEQRTPIEIARSAAITAAPYADQLAVQFSHMAEELRSGNDASALAGLGQGTEDLEHFLTFLILVSDILGGDSPEVSAEIDGYRKQLLGVLQNLEPALNELDLVEVADTLEHDVANSLAAYRQLHISVETALSAAA